MKKEMLLAGLLACGLSAQAQSCEGGLYLNPQVIRGEGSSQTESALKELIEFIRPTGLSVTPVLNIRETQEVVAALKRPTPPCWIYGNPVVGLASAYRPVAVNLQPIQSAVLILGDVGPAKDGKPVSLKSLPADQQAKVLARLKTTTCFGMKSGVTTSLVQAENLCGTVEEVMPQQGLGQSYLPTKAAFYWQPDRWAGLITRLQSAEASTLKTHYGKDERIHADGRGAGDQRELGLWPVCPTRRFTRRRKAGHCTVHGPQERQPLAAQGTGPWQQVRVQHAVRVGRSEDEEFAERAFMKGKCSPARSAVA